MVPSTRLTISFISGKYLLSIKIYLFLLILFLTYNACFSPNQTNTYGINNLKYILDDPNFDIQKTTTLYVHGYEEKQEDESIQLITTSYLERGNHNIVTLNWTAFGGGNYFSAALPNVYKVRNLYYYLSYRFKILSNEIR